MVMKCNMNGARFLVSMINEKLFANNGLHERVNGEDGVEYKREEVQNRRSPEPLY